MNRYSFHNVAASKHVLYIMDDFGFLARADWDKTKYFMAPLH